MFEMSLILQSFCIMSYLFYPGKDKWRSLVNSPLPYLHDWEQVAVAKRSVDPQPPAVLERFVSSFPAATLFYLHKARTALELMLVWLLLVCLWHASADEFRSCADCQKDCRHALFLCFRMSSASV
jgi:hypothetical protein